jgi:putative ABC transport system permease protein
VAPEKKDDFAINRQDQVLKLYDQLTGALYGVAVGVGLITLVVGGIGIMNIMLVSVTERTREIGVRRALGARRRTILLQFLIESSVVAALGGAVGTILGLGVAQLVALVTPLAAAVTPSAVLLGLGFSTGVGLLFGSWPAWRAAQLDPVEALRYE